MYLNIAHKHRYLESKLIKIKRSSKVPKYFLKMNDVSWILKRERGYLKRISILKDDKSYVIEYLNLQ